MDIQNDNGCGQGLDLDYVLNPYHECLLAFGYEYSHSTRVTHTDGIKRNHHTYKRAKHSVTIHKNISGSFGWATQCGNSSGRHTVGAMVYRLERHLLSKSKRYPELRLKRRKV